MNVPFSHKDSHPKQYLQYLPLVSLKYEGTSKPIQFHFRSLKIMETLYILDILFSVSLETKPNQLKWCIMAVTFRLSFYVLPPYSNTVKTLDLKTRSLGYKRSPW